MSPGQQPQENGAVEPSLVFVRSERARNYRLTLRKDGAAVATIPVRGNENEARRFVELHRDWLDRARARQARKPRTPAEWSVGTAVLWRGVLGEIRVAAEAPLIPAGIPECPVVAGWRLRVRPPAFAGADVSKTGCSAGFPGKAVCIAADVFRVPSLGGDLRAVLEARFARLARIELPARAWELAAETRADLKVVTVRNQRSRWGSCSAGGTVSLNWRLIQTPDHVRDYIIYHELMHLREMNHSDRFWARVEQVCPAWREAERWLKHNSGTVGM